MAEKRDYIHMPITLNIHGLTIIGNLISSKEYFEKTIEHFDKRSRTEQNEEQLLHEEDYVKGGYSREQLAKIFSHLFEEMKTDHKEFMDKMIKEGQEAVYAGADPDKTEIEYIHLKNATIAYQTHTDTDTDVQKQKSVGMGVWRGKLSSIDGFAFGGDPSVSIDMIAETLGSFLGYSKDEELQ